MKLSLITTKLKKILTMRKAIVIFAISIIFIAIPLVHILAQAPSPAPPPASGSSLLTKVLAAGPLLILGAIVSAYVNLMGLLSLQMVHFLISIAQFNNFINFPSVVVGWTIVRDVVNMSFVIILLVIAISTILNIEAYSYRRLLPKLVLMAVLVNFSRTIAGLLIDVGQVFMLTFVNAFSAAAGGNFLKALHINDLLSLGVSDLFSSSISASSIFAAYLLAAIAITVTFIVLLSFFGILLFRALTLWFLIVLSPLAFALAAWPSAKANKYYGEWWSRFTDNIIVGPILAFFLWLALMMMSTDYSTILVPGSGGNGESAGALPSAAAITDLSAPATFVSFLIGIGILLMVLKMVSSMQVTFAGFGNQALDFAKKQGANLARLAGRGAIAGVSAGAGAGLRRLDKARGGEGAGVPLKESGLSVLANVPGVRGWARGKLGEARAERTKAFGAEGGKLAELTPAELDRVRIQTPPILTPDTAAKRAGQLYKLLTDKQYQAYLKKEHPEEADAMLQDVMKEYNAVTKIAPTAEITRKAMDIKKGRPDLLPAGAEFNDVALRMEKDDVTKLTPDTFTKVMNRPDMTADAKASWLQWARTGGSVGLRKASQDYRDKQVAAAAPGSEALQELQAQRFAEFKQDKAAGTLRMDQVGIDEMKNPLIAVEVATNNQYSDELESVLKKDKARDVLRDTLVGERQKRAGEGKLVAGEGTAATYTPEALAISGAALRSGASLNQTFNVDLNTSNFQEVADRNAYQAALQGDDKLQILLRGKMDMISKNDYNNELGAAVAQSVSYEDVTNLLNKAKEPGEQRNVFHIVEALKKYAETSGNPQAQAVVQSITENRFMTKQLERLGVTGNQNMGGNVSRPPRGGRGGGGGGTPAAPITPPLNVESLEADIKADIKKQVEAQVKKVREAEAKRLNLERARDDESRVEKRQQINEQIREALEEERKEKEQLNKIQPRGGLEL